jgi:hypothetical protein
MLFFHFNLGIILSHILYHVSVIFVLHSKFIYSIQAISFKIAEFCYNSEKVMFLRRRAYRWNYIYIIYNYDIYDVI